MKFHLRFSSQKFFLFIENPWQAPARSKSLFRACYENWHRNPSTTPPDLQEVRLGGTRIAGQSGQSSVDAGKSAELDLPGLRVIEKNAWFCGTDKHLQTGNFRERPRPVIVQRDSTK